MGFFYQCFRLLTMLTWAVWWGGLTFYAGVVVPIGSHTLGSTAQGFVTQQVSHGLNFLALLVLVLSIPSVFRHGRRWPVVAWGLLVLSWIGLLGLHIRLDQMLDRESLSVIDGERFYGVHQVYLWLTIVQWVAGMGIIWPTVLATRSAAVCYHGATKDAEQVSDHPRRTKSKNGSSTSTK